MKPYQLVICGADKLGRRLAGRILALPDTKIVLDTSSSLRRVLRLVRRGSLTPRMVVQMGVAELARGDTSLPRLPSISTNAELLNLLELVQPQRVFLFRAGLIVNRAVIASGVPILNLHCARVPEYGGLGSIHRALASGDYDQLATLHRVTSRIDEGEVLREMPYQLDPEISYQANEDRAYAAGMTLLEAVLRDRSL